MNSIIWIAVALFVLWLLVRLVFAITSVALHLLWIIGVILVVIWLAKKIF